MNLYTIGFTKKTAEQFFELLKKNGVKKILDIRLNNKSQLAGFAKAPDLEYFLKISGIGYEHLPEYAPDKELLDGYKKKKICWEDYEKKYLDLIRERNAINSIKKLEFDNSCLLCSEDEPIKCHRRIFAEFIKKNISEINIIHLK